MTRTKDPERLGREFAKLDIAEERFFAEEDLALSASISKGRTYKEIGEYWDEHSLDEHWDETTEVEFEVLAKRRHRITVDPEIYEQLEAEARVRGVVPETLVNLWLAERLSPNR